MQAVTVAMFETVPIRDEPVWPASLIAWGLEPIASCSPRTRPASGRHAAFAAHPVADADVRDLVVLVSELGLVLMQSLATRWGYERSEVVRSYWIEMAVPAAMTSKGGDRHGR